MLRIESLPFFLTSSINASTVLHKRDTLFNNLDTITYIVFIGTLDYSNRQIKFQQFKDLVLCCFCSSGSIRIINGASTKDLASLILLFHERNTSLFSFDDEWPHSVTHAVNFINNNSYTIILIYHTRKHISPSITWETRFWREENKCFQSAVC